MSTRADIVIVGGGIIGTAIAWEVCRRTAGSTAVLDPKEAGRGATQASAGMLAPYSEAADGGALLDLTIRGLDRFDRFMTDLTAEGGPPVPYDRSGLLEVATREDTVVRLEALARALKERGHNALLLDREAVRSHEPLLAADVLGGLQIPLQGYASPRALHVALTSAAVRRGVRFEQERAIRISHDPAAAEFRVETSRGEWSAGAVILAAGCWSSQIDIEGVALEAPVRPVRGQLLVIDWPDPPLRQVTWSERCYLVPGRDGALLVGATVEDAGFDERNTVAGVHDLMEAVCDLIPRAWTAAFREVRVGLRPGTIDGLPIVGPSTVHPRLIFATGHYRNGILLAPLTAQLVADIVLDGRIDPLVDIVAPGRFGRL